jgi:hypothetical protein
VLLNLYETVNIFENYMEVHYVLHAVDARTAATLKTKTKTITSLAN